MRAIKILCVVCSVLLLAGCSEDEETGPECKYYYECPNDQDCMNGSCRTARKCSNDTTCQPKGVCIVNPGQKCFNIIHCNTKECGEMVQCIDGKCDPKQTIDIPCDQACQTDGDCPTEMHCRANVCEADGLCEEDSECENLAGVDCVRDDRCDEGICPPCTPRCVGLCVNDTDCPEEAICSYGFCEAYPQDVTDILTAPPPDDGWNTKTPLKVGIGDAPLDFPVGVSMWGYGARLGPRTPYRDTLGGSDSFFDRPRAKAYVFDNGLKRIVIIKAPMGCSTDFMASHVAWRVYQETGENYLDRMVFSGPHSHSHPARFWYILPGKKMGVLAYGDWSFEIFQRISKTLADAVLAALDDLKPARFGYAVMDPMDPDGKVHRYRRGEFPTATLDDSLVVMRIDDDAGNLRGALVNFGMHGTHFDGTTVSQDAPGGVELIAQQNLQAETGLPVKVAFLSGNSGDISPAGDGSGLDDWRKIQEVGVQAWPKIKQLLDGLKGNTTSDVELDIGNLRAPVNREALDYGPDEFYDVMPGGGTCERDRDCTAGYDCVKGECATVYYFGAFQCVMSGDEDIATVHEDGHLGCIFSAATLADGRPVPQFCKTRFTVLRIGELGLITVPGEPMSTYGRDLAGIMMDQGYEYATILGYSQDHHLYIMHEDNWMQGGYEPSMGLWGWREGEYYFEKSAGLIEDFVASGGSSENDGMKPTWFDFLFCQSDADCGEDPRGNQMMCNPGGACAVVPTQSINAGTVSLDAPATVERIGLVRLIWTGGHPGVDLPKMTLERDDGGGFAPVLNTAGEEYNDDGFTTSTWYRGDYREDHTWELTWEESNSFPAGRYLIKIDGHHFDGSGPQAYTVTSQAFDFAPSSKLIVYALTLTNDRISGVVFFPPGPTNDDGTSAFDELQPTGFFRHTGSAPPTMPWAMPTDGSATVTIGINPPTGPAVQIPDVPINQPGNTTYTYVSSRTSTGTESTDSMSLPSSGFDAAHTAYTGAGTYSVTVTATDALGNTGTATVDLQLN